MCFARSFAAGAALFAALSVAAAEGRIVQVRGEVRVETGAGAQSAAVGQQFSAATVRPAQTPSSTCTATSQ